MSTAVVPGGSATTAEPPAANRPATPGSGAPPAVRSRWTTFGWKSPASHAVFAPGTNEDKVMEAALEAGAEDVVTNDDGSIEVICSPIDFVSVKQALDKAGLKPELAEVTMKPTAESELKGEDAAKMQKLIDALESLDDVQDVYTTALLET